MAVTGMIAVFIVGYVFIALEHKIKINKSATALLMSGVLWTIFILSAHRFGLTVEQVNADIATGLESACEILVYLIGAMTIVDLIDLHGGFNFITRKITTRNKVKLLWIITIITFFMSAALDNMTTTIIMVMLLRKLIANYKERWVFASVIVIAANSGGAWSPIGDVTTIMLWMKGNVSSQGLMGWLFLPSAVSTVIPAFVASRILRGIITAPGYEDESANRPEGITEKDSRFLLVLGVLMLLFVPVYKTITHLPPYMAMMISLGVMWLVTEVMYDKKRDIEESIKERVAKVLKHIDMSTILFFLGILMAVSALESAGVLGDFAGFLDRKVHNIYAINTLIGVLSSIVDNVPLVAATMGMYPVADPTTVAAAADPSFAGLFVADGPFWHLLAYCAGVGGSLLIIGSAAGVVAMGLEKINFMWYLKNFSLMAFIGYLAGIGVFMLEMLLF